MIGAAWKLYTIGGLALASIASAGLYLHERDKGVRRDALLEVATARADSLTRAARADSIAQAREDSLAALRIARADSARARAERAAQNAAEAARRAREGRDSLETAIMQAPDSLALTEAVEAFKASHRLEVMALDRQITSLEDALAAQDSVDAVKDERLLARDRTIVGLRQALAASNQAAGIDTSRGWIERTLPKVGWAAAGAAVGYLAAGGFD